MRKMIVVCFFILVTFALGPRLLGQNASDAQQSTKAQDVTDAAPVHYYHLEIVVQELGSDGKPVNSRAYSTTTCTQPHTTTSVRTGSRIPIITGSYDPNPGKMPTQFQYQDVGVNFDVRNAHEIDHQLAFELRAQISGVAAQDPNLHEPILRDNRWEASVLIPIGKSTVVFTSDSTDSKGGTRVLVTATSMQ